MCTSQLAVLGEKRGGGGRAHGKGRGLRPSRRHPSLLLHPTSPLEQHFWSKDFLCPKLPSLIGSHFSQRYTELNTSSYATENPAFTLSDDYLRELVNCGQVSFLHGNVEPWVAGAPGERAGRVCCALLVSVDHTSEHFILGVGLKIKRVLGLIRD